MQQIKNRIQSIAGTRQITQSMRLVSTAKVQRAKANMTANQPFTRELEELVRLVAGGYWDKNHPFLAGRKAGAAAVIAISSDRGLCGGYNIGVGKEVLQLAEDLGNVRLVTVGARARNYCKRHGLLAEKSFMGASENPFYDDAGEIAHTVLEWFREGQVGSIHLVYTKFRSLLAQSPISEQLLPLPMDETAPPLPSLTLEPEEDLFLKPLVRSYVVSRIYGAMLESFACEQSARITSMDSAVKNADEMMESLSMLYNQARQSAITQEVSEIVGGADALKDREEG